MRLTITLAAVAALFFLGCAGSPAPQTSSDMVANAEPYEIGVVGASFSGFTGIGMNLGTFPVMFAPRTNEIILVTSNQGNDTFIYLNRSARDQLLAAASTYIEQFEARTLDKEGSQLSAYGGFPAFMKWGVVFINAEGTASISVGYEFAKDSPYFAITVPDTDNDRYMSTTRKTHVKKSGYFQIFFTKSQLIEFAEYLVQENLESTLEEKNVSRASTDPDEY